MSPESSIMIIARFLSVSDLPVYSRDVTSGDDVSLSDFESLMSGLMVEGRMYEATSALGRTASSILS